jgi:hypothetical protein
MAVRITISSDVGQVVFDDPAGVQQSDLVFWFNADSQPHFPIPGCGNLRVSPGNTSPQYHPFVDSTSLFPGVQQSSIGPANWPPSSLPPPLAITYVCALHEGEEGTLTVAPDNPPPYPGSLAISPRSVPINIRRNAGGVVFETVDVAQGDSVEWFNQDNEVHWPVPNCTGLLVAPQESSNAIQPGAFNCPRSPNADTLNNALISSPAPLPTSIVYGCAMPGHGAESGTINVYDNLAPVIAPAVLQQQGIPIEIVTGGKSPYTIAPSNNPLFTLQETPPAGSSGGVAAVLTQSPSNTTLTSVQVDVTDALNKTLSGTIQVQIYLPMTPVKQPPSVTQQNVPVLVVSGGLSPYTITQDPAHPELTIEEMPPTGSSAGVAVVLTKPSAKNGATTVQINVTDAFKNTFNLAVPIVIGENANA